MTVSGRGPKYSVSLGITVYDQAELRYGTPLCTQEMQQAADATATAAGDDDNSWWIKFATCPAECWDKTEQLRVLQSLNPASVPC